MRVCVRAFVCPLTLSNMNFSANIRPIAINFYLKHHWAGGKAMLGFGQDRIGTLVSMAAPIGLLLGKSCQHSSAFIFDRIFCIFAGNEDNYNISDDFEIRQGRTKDCGVSLP